MHWVRNFHPFFAVSRYRFQDKHFSHKNGKISIFFKFRTHALEVLTNNEKTHLLGIGNIAAKFEEATPCSHRDMLWTKQ